MHSTSNFQHGLLLLDYIDIGYKVIEGKWVDG